MATTVEETKSTDAPVTSVYGLMAEFDSTDNLMSAAEKVRDAGFQNWDAHTPFPVHGLDQAMGVKMTKLPWIVACGGTAGILTALGLQYFANVIAYPFLISGKPIFSLTANIPVTFELMVLFSAFAALGGMFALNKLPRHANALFRKDKFRRVTSDRFFIVVEANDPAYNEADLTELLQQAGAISVDTVEADTSSTHFPHFVKTALITAGIIACILPSLIWLKRYMPTTSPQRHIVPDMDFQPIYKSQKTNPVFADDRVMRPQVEGTVARGDLEADDRLYRGIDPNGVAPALALVSLQEEKPAEGAPAEGEPAQPEVDNTPWVTEFPMEVTQEMMDRGQERYRIYCSVCHGLTGAGDGTVAVRAASLDQPTWVKPTPLTSEQVVNQPVGKLFNTASNGIRKMGGYASQISVEDRWAIILYVRALQHSRNATIDDVPEAERESL